MTPRTRQPGLTLVEVVISTAILALLGMILARIYVASQSAYSTGTGRVALQQRARQTMQRLTPAADPGRPGHRHPRTPSTLRTTCSR